jgi:thiamine pyrophosphate-dependent acetolactate synthase large subunit-like protein
MDQTGGEVLVETLPRWGVTTIFGTSSRAARSRARGSRTYHPGRLPVAEGVEEDGLRNPACGCELEPIDFAAVARAFHLPGVTIADPALCVSTLEEALRTPGPVVDPLEPPMPARITPQQALHFAEANRQKIAMVAMPTILLRRAGAGEQGST